jgi:F-type H+-transporting ATPase subunit gamma
MSSLREVKDRIGSVRSTLKITSAMKLVASSKLLKAERAIESLRPYAEALNSMLAAAGGGTEAKSVSGNCGRPWPHEWEGRSEAEVSGDRFGAVEPPAAAVPTIVLAFSSNSSMCGAFNANAVKKAVAVIRGISGPVEVWAFGRKMAEGLRKEGRPAARDYSALVGKPDFDAVAGIAAELRSMADEGRIAAAVLVYNHFVSTGRQVVVAENYLSAAQSQHPDNQPNNGNASGDLPEGALDKSLKDSELDSAKDFIIEPTRPELLAMLQPLVLNLRLYAALLDSVASEHAARMIAMQTATDNAQDLLAELTLEYNKGRQQKITSEILDLVSGESR